MSASAPLDYPPDVTASQWALLEPLLPEANRGPGRRGRPAGDRRQLGKGVR